MKKYNITDTTISELKKNLKYYSTQYMHVDECGEFANGEEEEVLDHVVCLTPSYLLALIKFLEKKEELKSEHN